jgi:hypothetical protein
MIKVELLDQTTIDVFPSAAIIMDFEPNFGIGLENVGEQISTAKTHSALKELMQKFAWVLWRGNLSACKLQSKEPRFKEPEEIIELIGVNQLLQKGAEVLLAINDMGFNPASESEKKNE